MNRFEALLIPWTTAIAILAASPSDAPPREYTATAEVKNCPPDTDRGGRACYSGVNPLQRSGELGRIEPPPTEPKSPEEESSGFPIKPAPSVTVAYDGNRHKLIFSRPDGKEKVYNEIYAG